MGRSSREPDRVPSPESLGAALCVPRMAPGERPDSPDFLEGVAPEDH